MFVDWIAQKLEETGTSQVELAGAIGLTESQMSKSLKGNRRFSAEEADAIRRFFGYRLPEDPHPTPFDAEIEALLVKLSLPEKQTVRLFLEALASRTH